MTSLWKLADELFVNLIKVDDCFLPQQQYKHSWLLLVSWQVPYNGFLCIGLQTGHSHDLSKFLQWREGEKGGGRGVRLESNGSDGHSSTRLLFLNVKSVYMFTQIWQTADKLAEQVIGREVKVCWKSDKNSLMAEQVFGEWGVPDVGLHLQPGCLL